MMEGPDIRYLFEPRSIAVIGASPDKSKIGYMIVDNIVAGGATCKVYPVNPKGGELLGLKIYKGLDEIDGDIDVAMIVIPSQFVFDAVKECAKKNVKFIPIITSGFSEIGNRDEERRIVQFAADNGMRILGPNIFGVYTSKASLNATFGPKNVLKGNVAIITQSGALGIALIGKTAVDKIGLSAMVSMGNKSDLDESDILDYLVGSAETKVIMIYIEGVSKGERFIAALKRATLKKPVIVIKSGRSKRGAQAAASHTGSLAGADDVFDAVMRQCGVLRAESLQSAFDWCKFLANTTPPSGDNTIIITNGGGIGVMATDACEKYGVKLLDDPKSTKEMFKDVVPEFGSTKNPIDLTGQATASHYDNALLAPLQQPSIHSVIGLYCETATSDIESLQYKIYENYMKYQAAKKPIIFSLLGGSKVDQGMSFLRERGVPAFTDVYEAVSCLGAITRYQNYVSTYSDKIDEPEIDADAINEVVAKVRAEGRYFLLTPEARAVMEAAKITLPRSKVGHNLDDAVKAAEEIGYPVVMKIVSKDIIHKSDAGGVALDLQNKAEVIDAYQAIMHSCREYNPKAVLEGVQVDEMVQHGTETIIGARRDRSFGPMLMFGLGGIYVEVMKDVAFRSLPLNRNEVMGMVKEIRSYPLLLGVRGEKMKDIDSVVETLLKVGQIVRMCPLITDIEINPLTVYEQGDGVKAVDVRILLSKP